MRKSNYKSRLYRLNVPFCHLLAYIYYIWPGIYGRTALINHEKSAQFEFYIYLLRFFHFFSFQTKQQQKNVVKQINGMRKIVNRDFL